MVVMRYFSLMVAVIAVTTSTLAQAQTWSQEVTIAGAYTEDSDAIIVYTTGSPNYVSGCVTNSWSFTASTEERRARMWATILTALTSGTKVKFWVAGDCGAYSYHHATAVQLVR
jgi:hypothetical protein